MAFAFLFFDSVGGGEWLVLLAVVLIVVGPKNLPAAARKMGQILTQLRRAADEFKRHIMTMDQEMEKAVNDVKKDYIDVAEDVDKTVSGDYVPTDAADPGSEPGDGEDRAYEDSAYEDRAYDYYGDDVSGEGDGMYSDVPPMMDEGGDAGGESAGQPQEPPAPQEKKDDAPAD